MKDSIFGSTILTSSVLVQVLKLKSLPHLGWITQAILDGLKQDTVEQMKLILVVSLGKVIEAMPNFVSPYLEPILTSLCQFDTKINSELSIRVVKVIESIASTSPRLLLPAITDMYSKLDHSR